MLSIMNEIDPCLLLPLYVMYEIQNQLLPTLGGSLANPCIPTNCLVDRLLLGGRRRGFSPSFSVSSSITHQRVICVCILLPYYFTFHFTAVIIRICVRVACLFICSPLHYSALRIKLV